LKSSAAALLRLFLRNLNRALGSCIPGVKEDIYFWYLLDERGVLLHQQKQANSDGEVFIPIIRFSRQVDQRLQGRLIRKPVRTLLLFELQRNNETRDRKGFEPRLNGPIDSPLTAV
jgi:hypothetical protein